MTEYQKTYIELKKQFVATNEGPDSVRALYTFKEELEQSEDQQAKEVLVDVYDLLDFKKDAYELLCQIGNRSDKKTLKRLGTLKDYADNWGNHYALPKPKTPEEKQKAAERAGFTFFHNTGESSKPTILSRIRRACWAFTRFTSMSVSYTHLDVYKRQPLGDR